MHMYTGCHVGCMHVNGQWPSGSNHDQLIPPCLAVVMHGYKKMGPAGGLLGCIFPVLQAVVILCLSLLVSHFTYTHHSLQLSI